MLEMLNGYVMWKEMTQICLLDSKFKDDGSYDFKRITGNVYIKKDSIKDPILRLEVESCTVIDECCPFAVIIKEASLLGKDEKKLRKSHHTIKVCNTYLFKFPKQFIDKSKMTIHAISHSEEEEGYDTVVSIAGRFKIAGYH